MDQWIADAPSTDLRTSATTLRDATKQAIDSGELDPFDSDDAVEALLRVTLYCG